MEMQVMTWVFLHPIPSPVPSEGEVSNYTSTNLNSFVGSYSQDTKDIYSPMY